MSSTNRGAERNERDFYETPERTVTQLLRVVGDDLAQYGKQWLEPCIGGGAIVRATHKYWAQQDRADAIPFFTGVDIESQLPGVIKSNYLLWLPEKRFDVVITNPPFFIAQECIEHSMNLYHDGFQPLIIMLLRLGFFGSKKRSKWWQGKEPDAIYPLSDRPDFGGTGRTDSADYAWFFWNWHRKEVRILEGEPEE